MNYRRNPYDFSYLDTIQYVAGESLVIRGPSPLAHLSYKDELAIKQEGFDEFIRRTKTPGEYQQIIPSPFKRHYRTTTKRRVVFSIGHIEFRMNESSGDFPDQDRNEAELEPKQHNEIYTFLRNKLNEAQFVTVGKRCNYIVIRGTYKEFCVIFNMHQLDGSIVRRLKTIGELLMAAKMDVISSFVVHDPLRSRYYLDKSYSGDRFLAKKLFGPDTLRFTAEDCTWLYDPTSFSQINQSVVPAMLKAAGQLLDITEPSHRAMRLIDLYCGYGLFTLYAGRYFGEVFGIEGEAAAVKRGRDSIMHCKDFSKSIKVRMLSGQITSHVLESLLPVSGDKREIIILDPPRNGVEKGVLGALAFRRPAKVLHIFCNVDLIPSELEQWQKLGYKPAKIVPIDMFPGTPHLEVLVLLEPLSR